MKKIGLSLLFMLCMSVPFAQAQDVLAKVIVTNVEYNGHDMSSWAQKRGTFTAFYTIDGKLYLANCASTTGKSWGPIYGLKSEYKSPQKETYQCSWEFHNSYDSKTGICNIKFTQTFKSKRTMFEIKIITENLDVMIYKGFMEGTFDFSKFVQQ